MTIKEIKEEPNQHIIGLLEDLLEDAKNRKIQAIAIACVNGDCTTSNGFYGDNYPVNLIGELRCLERDIMDCNVDIRRKPLLEYCE